MLDLYTIRPLQWENRTIHEIAVGIEAIYRVYCAADSRGGVLEISTPTNHRTSKHGSMADAKDVAEKHHRNELLGWLDKFNPDQWSCVTKGDFNA